MSITMNKVILAGNNVRDLELKKTSNDRAVVSGSVAVQRFYNKETKEAVTDFIRYSAFGKTAEYMAQYVKKGTPILIDGQINVSYAGEGEERHEFVNVVVNSVQVDFSKKPAASDDGQLPMPDDGFEDIPDQIADAGLPFSM